MPAFEIRVAQSLQQGRPVFGHASPRRYDRTCAVPGEEADVRDEPIAEVDQEFEEYFFE